MNSAVGWGKLLGSHAQLVETNETVEKIHDSFKMLFMSIAGIIDNEFEKDNCDIRTTKLATVGVLTYLLGISLSRSAPNTSESLTIAETCFRQIRVVIVEETDEH